MATHIITPAFNHNYTKTTPTRVISRFMGWCQAEQEHRMLWQGIILTLHGCILTPVVMLFSFQAGVDSYLWIPVMAAMAINLVPNLAALPTKITIPIFFLSILIDLLIVAAVLL